MISHEELGFSSPDLRISNFSHLEDSAPITSRIRFRPSRKPQSTKELEEGEAK